MLDFQELGWPPEADQKRLDDYERRMQLYESRHEEAFSNLSAALPPELASKSYLIADYPRMIAEVGSDLLFGEPPVYSAADGQAESQNQIDELVRVNSLNTTTLESEIGCIVRGDAVFRLRVAQGRVMIQEVPAYSYFVELDPDDCRTVLSECIAWERRVGERKYLRVEHHLPGTILHGAFDLGPRSVGKEVDLAELYGANAPAPMEETGVDFSLLFHSPNLRHGSVFWGESDYTLGLESLFDSVNGRLSELDTVLDKHAAPRLVLPEDLLDKKGNVVSGNLQVIGVPPEFAAANLPRALTWDGQLSAVFQALEMYADLIFKFSSISPAVFGEDKAGSIESGRAMKFRFMRTLAKIARKRSYRDPLLKRLLWCAQQLGHKKLNKPAPVEVEITWQDGLPLDVLEQVQIEAQRVGAGIGSRHMAIRRIDQVGDLQAGRELERINEETAQTGAGGVDLSPASPPPAPNEPPPAAGESGVAAE